MSSSLPLVVSFLACCVAVTAAITPVERAFEQYLKDFGKSYKDPVEKQARFEAFLENYEYILRENSKGHSYTLGFTYFTDMSVEDFETSHFGMKPRKPSAASRSKHVVRNVSLPSSVDWRTEGAVTAVKNQEQCGSCWAFSSTGALEGAWAIATGKLESLSEQQLVDCSSSFGNEGCNGGDMDDAFQYEEENAVCTEQSYPYTATGGICDSSSCTVGIPRGSVTGYVDVEADDEEALMDAVAQQPVSVAIEADKRAFQNYKSGVLSKVCGTSLDHGVLVVGYGTEWGRPYWLVKNSWGSFWGEDGYVKLERGKPGAGECGVKSEASYPVVAGGPAPSPPPSHAHYGKPPCLHDESPVTVLGKGSICAADCTKGCPKDVPAGTTARPYCRDDDYCALGCMIGGCPKGAKCVHNGGLLGVCVYPDLEIVV